MRRVLKTSNIQAEIRSNHKDAAVAKRPNYVYARICRSPGTQAALTCVALHVEVERVQYFILSTDLPMCVRRATTGVDIDRVLIGR